MARLKPEDSELWRRVVRGVKPLPGRNPPLAAAKQDRGRPDGVAGETPALRTTPTRVEPLDRRADIDRATLQRLERGHYPIADRLDLHGMTQEEAHRALSAAIAGARAAGRRCLLVVTGHGRMSGGILRHAVPRWLDEPRLRQHILAIALARPQHGGHGALYLLLRRLPV